MLARFLPPEFLPHIAKSVTTSELRGAIAEPVMELLNEVDTLQNQAYTKYIAAK
jgi:hypothetical protein